MYEMCALKHAFEGKSLPALVMRIVAGRYQPLPKNYSLGLRSVIGEKFDRIFNFLNFLKASCYRLTQKEGQV